MRSPAVTAALAAAIVAATVMASPRDARPAAVGELHRADRLATASVTIRGGGNSRSLPIDPAEVVSPLDRFDPEPTAGSGLAPAADQRGSDGGIDVGQRTALREAGWTVPAKVGDSWVLRHARVLADDGDRAGTLQLVYGRGGETVSVFQRPAPLNWSTLPDGGITVPELTGSVREWPDAEPPRLVWQADERVFVLVGEVDRTELLAIANSLPDADTESVWRRLQRGVQMVLRRLSS